MKKSLSGIPGRARERDGEVEEARSPAVGSEALAGAGEADAGAASSGTTAIALGGRVGLGGGGVKESSGSRSPLGGLAV